MLYLYLNDKKQAAWQEPYEALYQREFDRLRYPYQILTKKELGKVTKTDFVWVMHYKDLALFKTIDCHVISQVNGTSVNPYVYQVDEEQEAKDMEIIDIALVFNERQRVEMVRRYPKKYYMPVGFPVEVSHVQLPPEKRPRSIVIPGRISPDKQFYLSTYLLQDLLPLGYTVTFCIPEDSDYQTWLDIYRKENFERLGFQFKPMNREAFLRELSYSEMVFLASLGDICSVSLAEALFLACYPIVPHFTKGLPTYDEYLTTGYEPFSKDSVMHLIHNRPPVTFDNNLFMPEECAKRFIEGMDKYIGRNFLRGVLTHEGSL